MLALGQWINGGKELRNIIFFLHFANLILTLFVSLPRFKIKKYSSSYCYLILIYIHLSTFCAYLCFFSLFVEKCVIKCFMCDWKLSLVEESRPPSTQFSYSWCRDPHRPDARVVESWPPPLAYCGLRSPMSRCSCSWGSWPPQTWCSSSLGC